MTVSVPLPSLTERFASIVARAVQGIGDLLERWPSLDPARVVPLRLVLLTRSWLIERRDAVTDLIAAFRAGTLKPPQPARPRTTPQGPPSPRRPQPERSPTRFGWFREMGADVGDIGDQLAEWLSETEMRELAAATPKAGRLLRPMLRMLGREIPEWLRLPPRPKPPEPEPFRPLDKRYNSVRRWKHHTVAPQEMPPPPPAPTSPAPPSPLQTPPAAATPPASPPPNPPPSPPTERPRIRWAFVDMSR